MVHEGELFEFPGRPLVYRHADPDRWWPAALAAARATCVIVEPSVVEVELGDFGEPRSIHHLVVAGAEGQRGGTYVRDPSRIRTVPAIDRETLVAWLEGLTSHGAVVIASLSIADGWYACAAREGDTIRLRDRGGALEAAVVQRGDRACVRAPTDGILDPPVAIRLDGMPGRLVVAIQWSPWLAPMGVGRARVDELDRVLVAAGWTRERMPSWEISPVAAGAAAVPARTTPRIVQPEVPVTPRIVEPGWARLPARTVELGLGDAELAELVDVLLEIDREDAAQEQSLGMRVYDAPRRRREIETALGTARGSRRVEVASCEIMRYPVTNAMWRAYVETSGAAPPASWAGGVVVDALPVTGVSAREAAAFAAHHGWALPTEAEWVLAATGGDRRWFPWGEWADGGDLVDRGPIPPPIGSSPRRASPFGVEDLLGGTCEYTADAWGPFEGGEPALFDGGLVCARGQAPKAPACIGARRGVPPDHRFKFARFRCVRRG